VTQTILAMQKESFRIPIYTAALFLLGACGGEEVDYRPTAAGAPSTDIFLGVLAQDAGGLEVTDLRNITDRDGYDNQPHFMPDGMSLLYVSGRDTLQTDVFRYDVSAATATQVTHTSSSEYSPTMLPDASGFSAIHEESTKQHLWRYDLEGGDRGAIIDDIYPVGYHAWGDDTRVVVFVLGDSVTPQTLQLVDTASDEVTLVTENPGRSLHKVPGRAALSFVHKMAEGDWAIKELDLATGNVTTLVATLPDREDYAWLPDGSIVMGDGSVLHRWVAGGGWTPVADLAAHGVEGISRIAVSASGDRIAIVGARPAPGGA
jgi:hypothetical protein